MSRKKYTDADRTRVINSSKKRKDKTERLIAESLGVSEYFVNKTIAEYVVAKHTPKSWKRSF